MVPLLAALPLLANVVKVDIRATGTPDAMQQTILKGLLTAAYAGAGLTVNAEHMTVHAGAYGSTVVEVDGTGHTTEQLDGYWCMNDPALRNGFKDLAVINTGLSDVTGVHTCVGPSGEGCESSTPCDGNGSGDSGTEEPEPAPEPDTDDGGSGDDKNDDDGNSISTAGIVLVVIGTLACVAVLLYIFWPSLMTICDPAPTPMVSSVSMTETRAGANTGAAAFLAGENL